MASLLPELSGGINSGSGGGWLGGLFSSVATGVGSYGLSQLNKPPGFPKLTIPPPPGAALISPAGQAAAADARRRAAAAGGLGSTITGAGMTPSTTGTGTTSGGKSLLGT